MQNRSRICKNCGAYLDPNERCDCEYVPVKPINTAGRPRVLGSPIETRRSTGQR